MSNDDAMRAWISSIGPGKHDFAALRDLWISLGNAKVSDVQLGRWLSAAGFVKSRSGKAKRTIYSRGKCAARKAKAAPPSAASSASPMDAVAHSGGARHYRGGRLLAWRFARILPPGRHALDALAADFSEWCDLTGVDAVPDAVLAAWLAADGCEVDMVAVKGAA